jgi:uncharacterized protein
MQIIKELIQTLSDKEVVDVRIGLHWTAVVVQEEGVQKCGLSSTLGSSHDHETSGADVPAAGSLTKINGLALAEFALDEKKVLRSVGMAAINALLPSKPELFEEDNAEEMIARHGAGKKVALIGHFPFIRSLKERVGELTILELNPRPGDLHANQAENIIPDVQVLAVTSMTFPNHTLDHVMSFVQPGTIVIMLGPTTPLTPLLYDYGIDILSGSVVEDIPNVLLMVSQGAGFRQIHNAGVRLVNMMRPGIKIGA